MRPLLLTLVLQAAAFCFSAVASGTMFWRWFRMSSFDRQLVWALYGWFCGLSCIGSCLGVATWAIYSNYFDLQIRSSQSAQSGQPPAQIFMMVAQADRLLSPFLVLYAIEILFLSVAKLFVLERIMRIAVPYGERIPRHWILASQFVVGAVVAGNVVGLGASSAAALFWNKTAELRSDAAFAFAANKTEVASSFLNMALQKAADADRALSLQYVCEAAVLLFIIVAFVVAGASFSRYSATVLHDLQLAADGDVDASARIDEFSTLRSRSEGRREAAAAGARGKRQLRQVVITAAIVFVTFLLRAVYSTTFAVANALQNDGSECAATAAGPCDASCYNEYALMRVWLVYTPEVQLIVVLITSPLTLLAALWGMTTEKTLQLMKGSKQTRAITLQSRLI